MLWKQVGHIVRARLKQNTAVFAIALRTREMYIDYIIKFLKKLSSNFKSCSEQKMVHRY
jgi:hypothetical protein